MIFVPQLCRNRLEGGTNLSNVILLPIEVQLYEFHGKSEKLKKKKLWITTKKKVTKKAVLEKYREVIITHTALAHSELSQTSKTEPFAKTVEY